MSVTVTTGAGSLISLGMNVSDVASLYALGRRVGNWVTASSGDVEFLDLLQSDELDILRRRGMIDISRFNARWAQRARLLMNGQATELVGNDAAKVLGTLSRFTASMVAVVAALDGFMNFTVLKEVMKRLLKELLRTTEYGEDVLSSQLNDRVSAWRSTAYLRGLTIAVERIRQEMVVTKKVLDGYMPAGDAQSMADLLTWLLSGSTEVFTTPSSDVAGVAVALSQIGFDILSVDGWGFASRDTSCKVVYMPVLFSTTKKMSKGFDPDRYYEENKGFWRDQSTSVSLEYPEESMSAFPVSMDVLNDIRQAWSEGKKAAAAVRWQVDWRMSRKESVESEDVMYELVDLGSSPGRVQSEIYALAKEHGFCINKEYCIGLSTVFARTKASLLSWLHNQGSEKSGQTIGSPSMQDQDRINVFTVYQAFLFGYYYAVFLPFVDTKGLAIQTVSGAWGFRSPEVSDLIREIAIPKRLTREGMLTILAALCFSQVKRIPDAGKNNRCLGMMGKRALLVNSLVAATDCPQAIGRFTLFDVAVGNIPSDVDGLVRPGHATGFCEEYEWIDSSVTIPRTITPLMPEDDFTKHIEPDWDANPETMLLVMRYKGRRVATINPASTDLNLCRSYVDPVEQPHHDQKVPLAINFTVKDIMARRCFYSRDDKIKVVVHSKNMPGVRYTAVSAYPQAPYLARMKRISRSYIALVSNCVVNAASSEDARILVT